MVTQAQPQQDFRFMEFITVDVVTAGTTTTEFLDADGNALTLETLRQRWGNNLNTLIILNIGAVNFNVLLDGKTITTVNKSNGSFSFDWKDGVIFNRLEVKNIDSVTSSANGDLRITVGRTGFSQGA